MRLRTAGIDDAAALARVHVQAWRETYAGILPQAHLDALSVAEHEERWRGWLSIPTTAVHVAERDGEVVGFTSAGPAFEGAPAGYEAEIYAIYVLRKAQGEGLGRRLFDASREATGGRALVVWALERNPWRRFYEKLGGRVVATRETTIDGETLTEVAYGWEATDAPFSPASDPPSRSR